MTQEFKKNSGRDFDSESDRSVKMCARRFEGRVVVPKLEAKVCQIGLTVTVRR